MYNLFSNVRSDREFGATPGMSKVAFYELVYEFEAVEAEASSARLSTGGRKKVLASGAQRLLLLLYYMKTYPSFEVLASGFDIDASTAERYVVELLPILSKTLGKRASSSACKAEELARLQELLDRPKSSCRMNCS